METRRKRGDLIQTYRILSGKDNVSYSSWFTLAGQAPATDRTRTRSETGFQNIVRIEAKGEVRRNAFAPRVVAPWNALPNEVKQAPTVNAFKNRLPGEVSGGRRTTTQELFFHGLEQGGSLWQRNLSTM